MRYYRCKCGKCEAWGSMPPYACSGCENCGTTLDTHSEMHTTPKPHDFSAIESIMVDQGAATITRCCYCHRTRAEIEGRHGADTFEVENKGVAWNFRWTQRRNDYPKGWLSDDRCVYVIPVGVGTFHVEYADPSGADGFFGCNEDFKTKEDAARAGFAEYHMAALRMGCR